MKESVIKEYNKLIENKKLDEQAIGALMDTLVAAYENKGRQIKASIEIGDDIQIEIKALHRKNEK